MSDQNYTPRHVQSVKRLEYSVRIYFRFWSLWSKSIRLILVLDFRYETHALHNASFLKIVSSHHKVMRKLEPRKERNTTKQSSNISGIGLNRTQRAKSASCTQAHSFAFSTSLFQFCQWMQKFEAFSTQSSRCTHSLYLSNPLLFRG